MRIGILPEPWTGFTQFTILNELLDGYVWSEWRVKKSKQPQRPDHLWPENGPTCQFHPLVSSRRSRLIRWETAGREIGESGVANGCGVGAVLSRTSKGSHDHQVVVLFFSTDSKV